LPDGDVDRIVAANEAALLARYPGFAPEAIRADIVATRERGVSLNPGRLVASSWGIGRAFRYPDGRVAGALSIAAIDSRMTPARQSELAALLTREAARMEALLAPMFLSKRGEKPMAAKPQPIETGRAR
ncbi:MAG: IclR family transcriptional regulator, partial [Bosea sp.]|nr:IclR family transcriptional regulator [Bosea sp. (in: a-proteobacteria)]